MFRFVPEDKLTNVLGIGYDHAKLAQKIRLAKETNEKQFSQGLIIDPLNNRLTIYVPNGNIYSLV